MRRHSTVLIVGLLLSCLFLTVLLLPCQIHASEFFSAQTYKKYGKTQPESLNSAPYETKTAELASHDVYIAPALKQGINYVVPTPIQKNLNFNVGYDKWDKIPTLNFDYFMPVKAWNDKSVFLSPRVSWTTTRESYSMGLGLRQMLTGDIMVGAHAFHDWVRRRNSREDFLREAGFGLEFSALLGKHSDLTLTANAYLPTNHKLSPKSDYESVIKEILPTGGDLKLTFQFPAMSKHFDAKLDAQYHSYRGETTNISGYKTALNMNTRNGLFSTTLEYGKDSRIGESYSVQGNVSLAFDWTQFIEGKNPLSAPYEASDFRFTRKIHDSLYDRVKRRHDLPFDKSEKKVAMLAEVLDETIYLTGGFPHYSNEWLTVQTSQSPWEDHLDVMTDSNGKYSCRLNLPPGTYRIRLVHKGSGVASQAQTVVVGQSGELESAKNLNRRA